MDITLHKLDEIIELLRRIEKNTKPKPLTVWGPPFDDQWSYTVFPDSTTNTDPVCNCHLHKSGESTGGWFCPVHG